MTCLYVNIKIRSLIIFQDKFVLKENKKMKDKHIKSHFTNKRAQGCSNVL